MIKIGFIIMLAGLIITVIAFVLILPFTITKKAKNFVECIGLGGILILAAGFCVLAIGIIVILLIEGG